MTDDMTCKEFAELLKTRDAHYPISDRYVNEVHDSPDKSGDDEREHMIIWFEANDKTGTGPYSRSTPNTSARRCYARLGTRGRSCGSRKRWACPPRRCSALSMPPWRRTTTAVPAARYARSSRGARYTRGRRNFEVATSNPIN